MTKFIDSEFVKGLGDVTTNLYQHGWDERNGGNVSYRIMDDEVAQFEDTGKVLRNIPIDFDATKLAGQYFLVTGTGRYFKNIKNFPERDTGLVRIADNGTSVDLMWGFNDGGEPTSEFPSHLMSHIARQAVDKDQRIIMHCHPTNIVAMTFTQPLDSKSFTRTIWKMHPEGIVVIPEGLAVIPYMCPGTVQIGETTAQQMERFRTVIWPHHGVFAAGDSLDETLGIIETIEKSALIFTTIQAQGGKMINCITDDDLRDLVDRFDLPANREFLYIKKP
ncbi:rhamnulose-1-phosphate aldolase [Lactobacillus selangorensis]|uniref:Rhamnulose-1-phosphate aldolase n=1 Tax=Lactobacillus selangorensis TaxID=81857 RepID=A0A0R2FRB4_9LACO|nr:rhamnulose-1-phosphate aldolase [Lactobacillus selangorensis]KRN27580.1 rhamnulose-1-phosphate aldolase [Lactobacillus selangorensis]KRN30147.1 rhamnulose-1-phosphate aldolase [Lactobacillus selangorensis]